jgi:hypothetical protein
VRKAKQMLNSERSTLNAQFEADSELDVERWTLDVGRFLSRLR